MEVYIHGALILHELRQEMGDEAFLHLLRTNQEQPVSLRVAHGQDFLDLAQLIHE